MLAGLATDVIDRSLRACAIELNQGLRGQGATDRDFWIAPSSPPSRLQLLVP